MEAEASTAELAILLEQLLELACAMSVEVRMERFGGDAATGLVKGKRIIFLDPGQPSKSKVDSLAGELALFDWEGVYLRPRLRELLESHRQIEAPGRSAFQEGEPLGDG